MGKLGFILMFAAIGAIALWASLSDLSALQALGLGAAMMLIAALGRSIDLRLFDEYIDHVMKSREQSTDNVKG